METSQMSGNKCGTFFQNSSHVSLQCDCATLPIKEQSLFPSPLDLGRLVTCFHQPNAAEVTLGQF